ncbi:MAG: hypothetical protein JXA36_06335 [Coriobacteriia bacterium]|nr:hypothetical protein [Coriobacteriia bacterium]
MSLARRSSTSHILLTLLLGVGLLSGPAHAASAVAETSAAGTQAISVEVSQPTPAITEEGPLRISVAVSALAPTDYLEVRLRLKSPSGRLVYQKTEIRSDLPAGRHIIEYEHDIAKLDLAQGRYPIEVRVLATDAETAVAESRLLVVDSDTPALPVALAVSAIDTPTVTFGGRFCTDPSNDSGLRGDLEYVAQLAMDHKVPLGLAVPPVLLEQYAHVAAGCETTAGVTIAPTDEPALRAAHMLQSLRSAADAGTVYFIDVPYALPDLAGLAEMNAAEDLAMHWAKTDAVMASVLRSAPHSKTAYIGPALSTAAVSSLEQRGASCILAPATAVSDGEDIATPGCYSLPNEDTRVLVVNERAALGASTGAEDFYDALFDCLEDGGPAVVMLELGPGGTHSAIDVQHALSWITNAPWLELSEIDSMVEAELSPDVALAPLPHSHAPGGYWSEIGAGRTAALAYSSAVGAEDIDARAVLQAMLVSESSLWKGTGDWASSARCLALTREAREFVEAQFSLVRLDATDVTLSGSKGNMPLTLINDTGKQLRLRLEVASSDTVHSQAPEYIDAQPTQNFLTIPLDLGNALSDEIEVSVHSGDLTVAESTVRVRASYVDRLATVGMVAVVLIVLLAVIRRRVLAPVAGSILGDSNHTERTNGRK